MPNEDREDYTLDAAAIADHELYLSWRNAGFDREQAFQLLLNNKNMYNQQTIANMLHGGEGGSCAHG